jgi:hypothetical protein
MANLFKRAAQAFGRITGRRSRSAETDLAQMPLIESVGADVSAPAVEPIDELIEKSGALPALAEDSTPWEEILTTPNPTTAFTAASSTEETTTTAVDEGLAVTASLYEAPTGEVTPAAEATTATPADETTSEVVATTTPDVVEEAPTVTALEIPVTETVVIPEAAIPEPVAPAAIVEDFKAPIEMKPDPAQSSLDTLADLYDLISVEVDKRTENTAAVYERLLAATREDLESARRNNRIAWSVGGVMTAVAAFGAIWSSGEVSATHTELTALKQQVNTGQLASTERDSLRAELFKVKETYAKAEIDQLKARLDQALTVSAERDRLHVELDRVKKDRQDLDTELRIARAAATTQPVSDARKFLERTTARTTVASGAERPDVWSVLLNGRD